MQREVVILGAGGHAKVIADIIEKNGDIVIGFLDDNIEIQGKVVYGNKIVLGTTNEEDIEKYKEKHFIIAIGSNKVRKEISKKHHELNWYTAIHPNAVVANDVEIGEGTVVMAGAIINPGSKIGSHCIINTSSSIDHDNIIENYVHISPGSHLAGTVIVKEGTWICSGVTVINNVTIAENNIIGAGATVINNIDDIGSTFIGVPTKKIK